MCVCMIVVVRVDDKPIRLQLCDTAGQVGPFRLCHYAAALFIV